MVGFNWPRRCWIIHIKSDLFSNFLAPAHSTHLISISAKNNFRRSSALTELVALSCRSRWISSNYTKQFALYMVRHSIHGLKLLLMTIHYLSTPSNGYSLSVLSQWPVPDRAHHSRSSDKCLPFFQLLRLPQWHSLSLSRSCALPWHACHGWKAIRSDTSNAKCYEATTIEYIPFWSWLCAVYCAVRILHSAFALLAI